MTILENSQKEKYGLVYNVYGFNPADKLHFKNKLIIYTNEQDKDVYDYKSARWDIVPQWDVRGTDTNATKEECLLLMEHGYVKQGSSEIQVRRYYGYHFCVYTEEVKALRSKYVCINPTKVDDFSADKNDELYVYKLDGYNRPFSWLLVDCNSDGIIKPEILVPSVFDDLDEDEWKLKCTETVFLEHSIQWNYNIETNMTEEVIEVYYDTQLNEYASYKELVEEVAF